MQKNENIPRHFWQCVKQQFGHILGHMSFLMLFRRMNCTIEQAAETIQK